MDRRNTLIAIVGVDGSGKTTACNNIIEILGNTRQNYKFIYMGRWGGHVLPVSAIEKKIRNKGNILEFTKGKQIKRILRDLFYAFEYTLRLFKLIWARKKNGFTITDRYCYDLLFVNNPTGFIKFFVKYVYPKPNLTFVLYNNPKIIFKRKGELTIEKLTQQQNILLNLKKIHKVKTENIEKTTLSILKKILIKRNRSIYSFLSI